METRVSIDSRVAGSVRRTFGRGKLFAAGLVVMAAGLLSSGCGSDAEAYNIPAEAFQSRPSSTLAAGDQIRVAYPGAPEMDLSQKIRANGKISLPMVGDVTAEGRSISGLQSQLAAMYVSQLQDPTVLVSLEAPAAAIYVSGEVKSPGKIALDRPMTALEAIMEADGFTNFANPKKVYVIRNQGGQHQRYPLNLSETLSGGQSNAFYLRPYDVIFVKQSNW